jgi:hypothetical protein
MPNSKDTNKGSNKEHIGSTGSNNTQGTAGHEPITGEDGRMDFTKSGKAYQIFDEMHKKDENVARKDCLERAVQEADMTPASAATFYQKWRDDNGMVHRAENDGRSNNQGNNGASTQPVSMDGKGATQKGGATASSSNGKSSQSALASKGNSSNKSSGSKSSKK